MGITEKDILKTVLKVPQLEEQLDSKAKQLDSIGVYLIDYKTDSNTWTQAFNTALTKIKTEYDTLILPSGNIIIDTITTNIMPLLKGQGTGATYIIHSNSSNSPIFKISKGGNDSNSAVPFGGFKGISFVAKSNTTDIIYFDGQIDNNMKFRDIQFKSDTNNNCNGINCKDFLNFSMSKVRFDGIGGWVVKIRDGGLFNGCKMEISDFSYDNQIYGLSEPLTVANGEGLIYMDTSSIQNKKAIINLTNGRVEVNKKLKNKSLIRIIQKNSSPFQNTIHFNHSILSVNWSCGNNIKLLTTNDSNLVNMIIDNSKISGLVEVYNNDNMDASNSIQCHQTTETIVKTITEADNLFGDNINNLAYTNKLFGRNIITAKDFNTAKRGFYENGDIIIINDISGNSSNNCIYIANTTGSKGLRMATGIINNHWTVDTTINSKIVTINDATFLIYNNLYIIGMEICIVGAGIGGTDLNTIIVDTDLTSTIKTITIKDVCSATLTRTQGNILNTTLLEVPINFKSAIKPDSSYPYKKRGDVVNKINPSVGEYTSWIYTWDDSISNWGYVPNNQFSATKGATSSRPTNIVAGYLYFDTSLSIKGKPIWYTGSDWVDATGTIV